MGDSTSDADGVANLRWYALDSLAPVHALEIRSGLVAMARIAARPSATGTTALPGADSLGRVDTVLAYLRGGISVRALDSRGKSVGGLPLRAAVISGGGTVDDQELMTDSNGVATTRWRLGSIAGPQSVEVRIAQGPDFNSGPDSGVRLLDLHSGLAAPGGEPLRIGAGALPGAPRQLTIGADTLRRDAIGAGVMPAVLGRDTYGNLLAQPVLRLRSADTSVARLALDGLLRTAGNGVTYVEADAGTAKASFVVEVRQAPVRLVSSVNPARLYWVGARAVVGTSVLDRLGAPITSASPTLRSLTPSLLTVVTGDSVQALSPGLGAIEATYASLADTLPITTQQVPATIVLPTVSDTMGMGQSQTLAIQVLDSGGSVIADPPLVLHSDDDSIVAVAPSSSLNARLPGQSMVSIQSGPVTASLIVTVEGVALLADGVPNPDAAALAAARVIELTNGRVRLRWHPGLSEKAAFEMDTRIGQTWLPATTRGVGDWVYVTSAVVTPPTAITLVENTPERIGLSMRFGDHLFDPARFGFPSWYQTTPFPFTRTLWLSPRQYGYYTWVQTEVTMPWVGTELEVGFGGLFGPASIRTGQLQFQTEDLTSHMFFNTPPVPDAAEFDLFGDPLIRVLVPLPEAAMISPVFRGWGYGSVYVHRVNDFSSYGAYLYAAPRSTPVSPRQLCQDAWREAPFPLRALSQAELDACGPS